MGSMSKDVEFMSSHAIDTVTGVCNYINFSVCFGIRSHRSIMVH